MDLLKKFVKTSGIYFLGKALSFVVTFLMLKVYTNNVSTGGYGYYDLVVSYIQMLIPFLFIEIWSGMLRRVLLHTEKNDKNKTISTSLCFLLGVLVFYSVAYFCFSSIFNFKGATLIFAYSVSYLFYSYFCILARALQKNKLFAISGVMGSLANAAIGLIAIYILKCDYEALFLSLIANYMLQVVLIFCVTKVWKFFKISQFDRVEAKELFKFCLPLSLNTLVNYAYTGLYKTIVDSNLGTDVLGVYTVSIKFAAIITFIGTIFHLAWQEISYSTISKNENKTHVYVRGLELFGCVIGIGCSVILPTIKILFPFLIGSAYNDAANLVPYYYLYIYYYMINGFLYNVLSAENKTNMLFVGKLVGTVVLLGLIFVLLQSLDIIAIPLSIVIASIIEYAFLRIYMRNKCDIKYVNYSAIATGILYFIGCYVYLSFGLIGNTLWLMIALILSCGVSYFTNKKFINHVFYEMKSKLIKTK